MDKASKVVRLPDKEWWGITPKSITVILLNGHLSMEDTYDVRSTQVRFGSLNLVSLCDSLNQLGITCW